MLFNSIYVFTLAAISIASPLHTPLSFSPRSGLQRRTPDAKEVTIRGEPWHGIEDCDDCEDPCKDKDCGEPEEEKDCLIGYIKLTTRDGEDYGYVGKDMTEYGAYIKATCDEDRLLVVIDEAVDTSGLFDIQTINGPYPDYPYLAGIVGWSSTSNDIGKGSHNHFYLGGTSYPTVTGESAQPVLNTFTSLTGFSSNVETTIFHSFNKEHSKSLDVQWSNSDGSCPETFMGVYIEDGSDVVGGSGDRDAFAAAFGKGTWVTLSFEEQE